MLKNSKISMVVSLLIAIALWIFVVGSMDPSTKQEYTNIPVTFTNVDDLNSEGFAIASCSVSQVDVTLQAKKSVLNDIEKKDIKAEINVGDLALGENKCRIIVKTPNKSNVYDQSFVNAIVVVETIQYQTKQIKVTVTGDSEADEEATIISQEKDESMVYGAKSLVEAVDHINAILEEKNITKTEETYQAKLVPVDKNNKEVKNVKVLDKTIYVTAAKYKIKTVPLNVNVRGVNDNGVQREITKPEEIILKGPADIVNGINSVDADDIIVSNVYSDSDLKIKVNLPEGVTVSHLNKELLVQVSIIESASRTFKISSSAIKIYGDEDYQIDKKTISIVATGKKSIVNTLSAKDFELSVDVSGQDAPFVKGTIVCNCDKELSSIEINPKAIGLILEEQ